jgi:hypothetical protein
MSVREAHREPRLPPDPNNPHSSINHLSQANRALAERIVGLEMKLDEELSNINSTLLSLAHHMQSQGSVTLPVQEVSSDWNPRSSDMLLWDQNEKGTSWNNLYKGSKIFLVCGGPSLNTLDLSLLDNRGVMSMCMNNSWCKVKPDFWVGFDVPGRFHNGGWEDPSILKFVPWQHRKKGINHRVGDHIVSSGKTPCDVPNCWFVSNSADFNPSTWFTESYVNWGGAVSGLIPEGGFRVTMIGALRILYYLGFQEVYLLGCDWEMPKEGEAYAWEENRAPVVREKNNDMYRWISEVLQKLQPGFEEANFQIYNCNRNSKLTLFPFIQYEDAIERCMLPELESTRGWYDIPNK